MMKDSFHLEDDVFTKHNRDHPNWEPQHERYVYTCMFMCNNRFCEAVFTNTGQAEHEFDEFYFNGEVKHTSEILCHPLFFHPPLKLMRIPSNVPDKVISKLIESFSVYFASQYAAINSARSVVELILDHLNIDRISTKNKRLNLHQRIELLPNEYAEIGELLLAIKWIGNAGSHPDEGLLHCDVLDGYEFLEHVLETLFEKKKETLLARAKLINLQKGP